jgi:hypothetical protein
MCICISQVDEEGLAALVSLLRVSALLAKGQLQRLFLNLVRHPDTRLSTLRLLLSLLRMPLSADEAENASVSRRPALPALPAASLADALQVR